jgi:hypothetical protein
VRGLLTEAVALTGRMNPCLHGVVQHIHWSHQKTMPYDGGPGRVNTLTPLAGAALLSPLCREKTETKYSCADAYKQEW